MSALTKPNLIFESGQLSRNIHLRIKKKIPEKLGDFRLPKVPYRDRTVTSCITTKFTTCFTNKKKPKLISNIVSRVGETEN